MAAALTGLYPQRVNRFLRILVVAALLGPPILQITTPRTEFCEETQDCCTPDGGCQATCPQCPCCASRSTAVTAAATSEGLDSPQARPGITASAAPLSPPPVDILHVPKSI